MTAKSNSVKAKLDNSEKPFKRDTMIRVAEHTLILIIQITEIQRCIHTSHMNIIFTLKEKRLLEEQERRSINDY